ncbi:MAG: hypothetical protein ACYDCK_11750 [Thermoplasmatota archaeon]
MSPRSRGVALALACVIVAGCFGAPGGGPRANAPDPPIPLANIPCDGQSSVKVAAVNWTDPNATAVGAPGFVVTVSVDVNCSGHPVARAEVEARFPDGRARKIVTDANGHGQVDVYFGESQNGTSVKFRVIINNAEMTESATVKSR